MQGIVGPIRLAGFPSSGAYYIDTLTQELGFGKLDAVSMKSLDGSTLALVTTMPLFDDWLKRNPDLLKGAAAAKSEPLAWAFASEEFYSSAFSDDAHYFKYADLPVIPGKGNGVVRAVLFAATQDYPAPYPPQGVVVAMVRGDQVMLLKKSVTAPEIESCVASYRADMAEAELALLAYQSSKLTDKPQIDRYFKLEEAADTHYLQCYAQRLPETASYASLVREAQALVDVAK